MNIFTKLIIKKRLNKLQDIIDAVDLFEAYGEQLPDKYNKYYTSANLHPVYVEYRKLEQLLY